MIDAEVAMGKVTAGLLMGFLILPIGAAQSPPDDAPRTIEVHAKRFSFSPSEITLKRGEKTEIHLISEDVTHALFVPDLGIRQEVSKGHPEDIVVKPEAAGDFHGQCARFCGAGHGAMTFTIHVTD